MFRGRVRHVHFVGIGGIGMSGLAEILRTLEFEVSGSDLKANENTRRLEGLGVRVFVGHAAENVAGADVVVYSSAIDPKNPEIARAHALEIPIIPRLAKVADPAAVNSTYEPRPIPSSRPCSRPFCCSMRAAV